MYSKTTTIINRQGLHARPASDFIGCASKFTSRITISRADSQEEANAKSIIMLLSLGISQNERVTITANGVDETAAVDALVALVDSGFGE